MAAVVPVRFANGGETQGLQADRDGVFHSAWIGGGARGTLELRHTIFAAADSLTAAARAEDATSGATGRVDLSLELRVDVSAPRIDFARGVLDVSVCVVNPTAHEIEGPIDVAVLDLTTRQEQGMGLEHLRVVNADNGKDGTGAMWRFVARNGNRLCPAEQTRARTLRFAFEPGIPNEPTGYFMPRLAIYGRSPTHK